MPLADLNHLNQPRRLNALRQLCLLDTPADPAFDRLTGLAARILQAPVALVTLVDTHYQCFKSQVGLESPWSETHQIPLTHSFCQHVVAHNMPLIIADARQHPLVYDNLAVVDLNFIAYAGIPLLTPRGDILGSFCVIDHVVRQWTDEEITILTDLAASATTHIALIAEMREREALESALRDNEERYRSVVSNMYEGVVLQDKEGVIRTCNPAAERILGLNAEQMMGLRSIDPLWHAIHEDGSDFPGETHPAMVTLRTGKPQTNIVMGVHKPDGQLTWILINSQALKHANETEPYAVLATFVDITERRNAEQREFEMNLEKERLRMLTDFIQNASHEFRTPLSIIQSCSYLIHQYEQADKRLIKAQQINQQTERISRLVDMLLLMTQLNQQDALINSKPLMMMDILRSICQSAQEKYPHIALYCQLPEHLADIKGNQNYLVEALKQIFDNAYHFTPDGGAIYLRAGQDEQMLWIEVQDTGLGIAQADLAHIFEMFWRQDHSHSTPGFGLGLAITKKIIDLHQGQISITSRQGQGTCVRIHLPLMSTPKFSEVS